MSNQTKQMREMARWLHSADAPEPDDGPGLPQMLDSAASDIDRLTADLEVVSRRYDRCRQIVMDWKERYESVSAEGTTMRIALQAIAKHYTPNWKPGDTHESTQRLSGIAHDALLVAAIRRDDTASGNQPLKCDQCGQDAPSHDFGCDGKHTADSRQATDREIAKSFYDEGMRCNCDLDNWEPERSTGHSHVCRIHKAVQAAKRGDRTMPATADQRHEHE